jgi:glycosyltransferase involved in cell wall biosynthesis
LRIAQVAPLYESVPPQGYGGTERVVSYLTEELVRQGHEVTLFASGDSRTAARLVSTSPRSLRLDPECHDPLARHLVHLAAVFREVDRFDFVHFHVDYLHYLLSRHTGVPHATTLHGRLDLPDLVPLYREFRDLPLVSISDAQRTPLPWLNWQATVYHGLPLDLYPPGDGAGGYLAFLGRISPEKRLDLAIEIARRSGLPLRVAAKVDRADLTYYREVIEPLLAQPHVTFLGEVDQAGKEELLRRARALLFPVDWPEPFGLVMIESMACGTPVVAYRRGSVAEVVDEGVTGFVCASVPEAVAAVQRAGTLSRRRCRARFEERFSDRRMARDYLAIYERILEDGSERWKRSSRSRSSSTSWPRRRGSMITPAS